MSHCLPCDVQTADKAIAELFKQTGEAIAGVVQVLTGQQHPSFTVNKPLLFNNGAANVSTNVVRSPAPCPARLLFCARHVGLLRTAQYTFYQASICCCWLFRKSGPSLYRRPASFALL